MNYGTLCDYRTGESLRPATREEWQASRAAEAGNAGGGTGVIEVAGQSVYVEGGGEEVITTSNSIGIRQAAAGGDLILLGAIGEGDSQMRLLRLPSGCEVIESNGDPAWEGSPGFSDARELIMGA